MQVAGAESDRLDICLTSIVVKPTQSVACKVFRVLSNFTTMSQALAGQTVRAGHFVVPSDATSIVTVSFALFLL